VELTKVTLPYNLDAPSVLEFGATLASLPSFDVYVFDFRAVGHVEPFGMLLLAAMLRQFKTMRVKLSGGSVQCKADNFGHCTYASHMGFFTSFGLDFGNQPGEAAGSGTYTPISEIDLDQLRTEARNHGRDVHVLLEEKAFDLARLLTRSPDGNLVDTLGYSIREMMRNVLEHSESSKVWYAGQCWPQLDRVEVAVLDEGVGIRATLSRNPHLLIESDEDSLRQAMMPRVSGVAFKGSPRVRYQPEEWRNTGYGLFLVSELCSSAGSFMLSSQSAAIERLLGPDGIKRESHFQTQFMGTALRMVLQPSRLGKLGAVLKELLKSEKNLSDEVLGSPSASMRARAAGSDGAQSS